MQVKNSYQKASIYLSGVASYSFKIKISKVDF